MCAGVLRCPALHQSDEAITDFGNRLDISRFLDRVPQHRPEVFHGAVQPVLEIHERVGGPELLLKLFAGNDVAPVFHQNLKHVKRLGAQLQPDAVAIELARPGAQFKATTEPDDGARLSGDILGQIGSQCLYFFLIEPSTKPIE